MQGLRWSWVKKGDLVLVDWPHTVIDGRVGTLTGRRIPEQRNGTRSTYDELWGVRFDDLRRAGTIVFNLPTDKLIRL